MLHIYTILYVKDYGYFEKQVYKQTTNVSKCHKYILQQ